MDIINYMMAKSHGGGGGGADNSVALIEKTITEYANADVTKVGAYAFYGCYDLLNVDIPNATMILESAFASCMAMKTVTMQKVTQIGKQAFYFCYALTNLVLPSSLTSIGTEAFTLCGSLKSVTFEGTPTTINSSAFNGCTNLKTINVPWAEGEVANAPWGATNATINYNYTGE